MAGLSLSPISIAPHPMQCLAPSKLFMPHSLQRQYPKSMELPVEMSVTVQMRSTVGGSAWQVPSELPLLMSATIIVLAREHPLWRHSSLLS